MRGDVGMQGRKIPFPFTFLGLLAQALRNREIERSKRMQILFDVKFLMTQEPS